MTGCNLTNCVHCLLTKISYCCSIPNDHSVNDLNCNFELKKRRLKRMSPQRAKRPCAKIGCPGLAEGGERYCPECKAKGINDHNEYKKQRTDKYEQSVYKTARWKVIRGIRLRLNPLCQDCEKLGRVTAAQMVDHIKPIKQGGDPYDLDNTQSLCNGCHNKKTANE